MGKATSRDFEKGPFGKKGAKGRKAPARLVVAKRFVWFNGLERRADWETRDTAHKHVCGTGSVAAPLRHLR